MALVRPHCSSEVSDLFSEPSSGSDVLLDSVCSQAQSLSLSYSRIGSDAFSFGSMMGANSVPSCEPEATTPICSRWLRALTAPGHSLPIPIAGAAECRSLGGSASGSAHAFARHSVTSTSTAESLRCSAPEQQAQQEPLDRNSAPLFGLAAGGSRQLHRLAQLGSLSAPGSGHGAAAAAMATAAATAASHKRERCDEMLEDADGGQHEHQPQAADLVPCRRSASCSSTSSGWSAMVQHLASSYYSEFGALPDVPAHIDAVRHRAKRQRVPEAAGAPAPSTAEAVDLFAAAAAGAPAVA